MSSVPQPPEAGRSFAIPGGGATALAVAGLAAQILSLLLLLVASLVLDRDLWQLMTPVGGTLWGDNRAVSAAVFFLALSAFGLHSSGFVVGARLLSRTRSQRGSARWGGLLLNGLGGLTSLGLILAGVLLWLLGFALAEGMGAV